jgi:hypothetical protein
MMVMAVSGFITGPFRPSGFAPVGLHSCAQVLEMLGYTSQGICLAGNDQLSGHARMLHVHGATSGCDAVRV